MQPEHLLFAYCLLSTNNDPKYKRKNSPSACQLNVQFKLQNKNDRDIYNLF